MALQIGSPIKKSRLVPRFEATILKMSGSLVEIGDDGTVRFIHLSVLEFLTQAHSDSDASPSRPVLSFDSKAVHGVLAMECLSYLLHDVPHQPLTTTFAGKLAPLASQVIKRHPLPLYATQFWAHHASSCCEASRDRAGDAAFQTTVSKLASIIRQFITDQSAVTTWTEAAWTFKEPPGLAGLECWTDGLPADVAVTLGAFARDLEKLDRCWGALLSENAAEIWSPSVPSFMTSQFWVGTKEQTATDLDVNVDPISGLCRSADGIESILIASQTSSAGTEVGLIKLWPSSLYASCVAAPDFTNDSLLDNLESLAHGWVLRYDINTIREKRGLVSIEVELPAQQVAVVLRRASRCSDPTQFEFPTSFSADLRQVAILTFVIRAQVDGSFACQSISLPLDNRRCPDPEKHSLSSLDYPCPCHFDWYHMVFSPSAEYLAILQGPLKPSRYMFVERELTMLQDKCGSSSASPKYAVIAKTRTKVRSIDASVLSFHPFDPVLAVACLSISSLWFFSEKEPRWSTVANVPLDGISFSHCGRYVYGNGSSNLCFIDVGDKLRHATEQQSITAPPRPDMDGKTQAATAYDQGGASLQLQQPQQPPGQPATIASNVIVFNRSDASQKMTMLQTCHDKGAVVLRKLDGNGMVQDECITKLPRASGLDMARATMVNARDVAEAGQVALVLDKAAQDEYSLGQAADRCVRLPVLATRTADTVPVLRYKRPMAIEGGAGPLGKSSGMICLGRKASTRVLAAGEPHDVRGNGQALYRELLSRVEISVYFYHTTAAGLTMNRTIYRIAHNSN
ncbi:hypothetical protein RB595_002190 [Gaeumannomyces hyphopodioides]